MGAPLLQGVFGDIKKLTQVDTPLGLAYSGLTAATAGAGLAYLAAPEATLHAVFHELWERASAKPEAMFLWETIGASMLMLAPWTFSMKVGQHASALPLALKLRHNCCIR